MRITPDVSFRLIQEIRLVHAISESGFEICIPDEHHIKFLLLDDTFGMSYLSPHEDSFTLRDITIDHKSPRSRIGSIDRTLILPHAIVDRCLSLWEESRPMRFSFAGLLTLDRLTVIRDWLAQSGQPAPRMALRLRQFVDLIRARVWKSAYSTSYKIGDLHLWSSNRGRVFPGKSWDNGYYETLGNSEFVLCPSGDYVWTYRFFEAILCGAIPIVEETCEAYEGFHFYTMEAPVTDLLYDPEIALTNFHLCAERLTVPVALLQDELERIVATPSSPQGG